jgi:UDP-glucuronate 4-epimerase
MDFVNAIESALGIEADKIMKPIQAGDVEKTWADVNALIEDYDYKPNTSIEKGIREFISWYRNYYNK